MEHFVIFIILILCILPKDYVQSSYVLNPEAQYSNHESYYIPNDSQTSYAPAATTWIPNNPNLYDYNVGYSEYPNYVQQQQQQQLQQQQFSNTYQQQQQESSQYQYPTIQQQYNPDQIEYQPYIAKGNESIVTSKDPYAATSTFYSTGQQQMQSQSNGPQFQEQYQSNQGQHSNGQQYEAIQYQYQDGMQQTQEQHIVSVAGNAGKRRSYVNKQKGTGYQSTSNYELQAQEPLIVPKKESVWHDSNLNYEKDHASKSLQYNEVSGNSNSEQQTQNMGREKTIRFDVSQPTNILCPLGAYGQFPYPFSNSQYINCSNGITIVESCPLGSIFNMTKSNCEVTTKKNFNNSREQQTFRVRSCPMKCNGSYLYPFTPTMYIRCQSSAMHIMSCSETNLYSVSTEKCINRDDIAIFDIVRSTNEMPTMESKVYEFLYRQTAKIECPLEAFGLFPYPFGNTKYIKCVNGRLLIKRCRPGVLYSVSRKLCDIPDHLLSFDTAVPITMEGSTFDEQDEVEENEDPMFLECPRTVNDNFIFPFINTRYTQCFNGVTQIKTCPSETVYSIQRKKCLSHTEVDDNDYVEGIERSLKRYSNYDLGVSCGPETNSLYPHPEDLRLFVTCQNGIAVVNTCDEESIFNITQRMCV